jgi:hypothetical protein
MRHVKRFNYPNTKAPQLFFFQEQKNNFIIVIIQEFVSI